MPDFEDFKQGDALAELEEITPAQASTLSYLAGDHWQGGKAWVGPPDADTVNRQVTLDNKVKPIFVSKNIVKEIVEAHRDAVIGQEPDWSGTTREALPEGEQPSRQQQQLITEAENLLTEWWDARQALAKIQDAVENFLATGRGYLRLWIPPVFVSESGTPEPGDLKTWLSRIYIQAPKVASTIVVMDEDTARQASVYSVNKGKDKDQEKRTELCFVDSDGKTILRKWEGENPAKETTPIDLGGNLVVFEMRRSPLITEQIRQNQALFNTTLTMRCRNVGVGGFPERTFLNARRPSHFEEDPNDSTKQIEVFDDLKVGAGVSNFIAGHTIEDEQGNPVSVTTASVSYRDPVNVTTFEDTERAAYQNILEESRQLHRLISRDATASGESRVQARADFVTSLRDTKTQVDAAGRWVLETALALAAALSDNAGRFADLRFRFESEIDTGPLSPDERRLIREETQGEKPLRSVQSAMKEIRIDDPAAMIQEIQSENEMFAADESTGERGNEDGVPVTSGDSGQKPAAAILQ